MMIGFWLYTAILLILLTFSNTSFKVKINQVSDHSVFTFKTDDFIYRQKYVGVFILSLVLGGVMTEFKVSLKVIILCSLVKGLGTSIGGGSIIKIMGMNMFKLEPHQEFGVETKC